MSDLVFNITAMRISQPTPDGGCIYVGKIKAKDLWVRGGERFIVDYYKSPTEGYQRNLNPNAVNKLKKFILGDETKYPMLPTTLLLNARNPLDVQELGDDVVRIKVNTTLYVIDGQHRVEAWKKMMEEDEVRAGDLGDFEFPVVILSGFPIHKEIEQFFLINSRQTKIKTDLAQRHLQHLSMRPDTEKLIPESKRWMLQGPTIVDILNGDEKAGNIWKGKIGNPNESDILKKLRAISQNSFIDSLKPFFSRGLFVYVPKSGIEQLWAEFIRDFWIGVGQLYPEAVKDFRGYSLMKTVGAYSLHIILADRLSEFGWDKRQLAIDDALKIIKKASQDTYDLEFWRSDATESAKLKGKNAGAYSSSVGHNRLAMAILKDIRL